jgi:hypothetical protein
MAMASIWAGSALVIDVVFAPPNGSDRSAQEALFSGEKTTTIVMSGWVAPEQQGLCMVVAGASSVFVLKNYLQIHWFVVLHNF